MHFGRCITLPNNEKQQLLGWGSDIFNSEDLALIWRPKEIQLVLYDGSTPVSTCGLLKQSIEVGPRVLSTGGIGGVVTPPQHQRKGYARRVLREALRVFEEEWSLDAGVLFCRKALVPFYEAGGWQQLEEPVRILQPAGMIDCPTPVMAYPLGGGKWPAGQLKIDSLPW